MPHSRNTGVDGEAIRKNKELTIVAESDETGPYIILNSTGSQVFVTGHPEYDVMSLHYEYVRDVKRGLNPDIPKNYYKDDDPTKKPVKSWRCHANAMYYNWLNYYVYQVTPYDLEKDKKNKGCCTKYGSLFEIKIQHVYGEKKGKQMIKLIATDIDGTLVADGTLDLNPEYYDVIKELKRRGTIVLAASGRQRASIEKVFTPVLDDISFISENGTCIHSKDYQYVDVIDPEIVRTYIEEARQFPGCEIAINKDNMTYMENIGIYQHLVGDYGYRGDLVDDVLGNPEGVCKMSIFHHNCAEDVVGDEFIKRWGKKMNVVVSGKCWVDCANKGANKGSALRHFQEEYGITPDETLAFGDNLNDIEMLKRASHSFAVENARDEVKEAANFVAPSYKEDGVLQVLKAVLSGELC